jgi:hypothetical protein
MPLDKIYIRIQATEAHRSRSQEKIERSRVEARVRQQAE